MNNQGFSVDKQEANMQAMNEDANRKSMEFSRNLIAEKLAKQRAGIPQDMPKVTGKASYKTYEDAKAAGDVNAMLFYKMGMDKIQMRAERRATLTDGEINVKAVRSRMAELERKIANMKAAIPKAFEDERNRITSDFIEAKNDFIRNGGKYSDVGMLIIRGEAEKRLAEVENTPEIKAMNDELQAFRDEYSDMQFAHEKFIKENAALINEEIKARRRELIRQSGLLDDYIQMPGVEKQAQPDEEYVMEYGRRIPKSQATYKHDWAGKKAE